MSEIDKRREWFNSRTDKELDEITQWMDARHEVKRLKLRLQKKDEESSKFLDRLQEAHEEIDRLKDEIEIMKEYEKIVDGVSNE